MTQPLHDLRDALELCRAGRHDEALAACRRFAGGREVPAGSRPETSSEIRPETVRLLETLAAAWLEQRRFEAAAEALSSAVALDGAQPRLWLGLGLARRELGQWTVAAAAYGRATELDPRLVEAWTGLALALVNDNRAERALAACRAALDTDGRSAEARRVLALVLLRGGRVGEAEDAALAALNLSPGYPEGLAALGLVRMMQNRLEEADALLAEATRIKPLLAEALGNRAVVLARLGREAEAMREAARAARIKPTIPGPFHLLGTLMRRAGQIPEAVAAFQHVLSLVPGHLEARVNLADTLRLAGDAKAAATVCLAGLEITPNHVGLLANLGAALQEMGDAEGALAAYGQALDLEPGQPEVENNLARLYREAGRLDKALEHLRRAAAARPGDGGIARNLAAALAEAGHSGEAEEAWRAALRAEPFSTAVHLPLAGLLDRTGRPQMALAVLRAAIALAPEDAEPWRQVGALLLRAGARGSAMPYCRRAARLDPDDGRSWALFAQSLRGLRPVAAADGRIDRALRLDLLEALAQPAVEKAYLMDAIVGALELTPAMTLLREAIPEAAAFSGDPVAAVVALLRDAAAADLARDPLLRVLLRSTVVTDPVLERRLTLVRRALLSFLREDGITALDHLVWMEFACALADQCFLNEYAFAETPEETAAVERLAASVGDDVARNAVPIASHLALLAAYRPLARQPWIARIVAFPNWREPLAGLLVRLVAEPLAEQAIASRIESLTPVADPVSQAVRAQYEENPYPRWRHAGLLDAPLPVPRVLKAILPHVELEPGPWWEAPDLLVAGCGTGRESVWAANQFAGARVLAVDLSRASLAYAKRQTESLGLAALDYAQADLLELGRLERRFDIVQCVGVLHHMADPLAGWRVLAGLLRPHGIMKVGLYSERARASVVAARSLIRQEGYGDSAGEIRRFRQDALKLADDHPAAPVRFAPDFFNVSACRDLLFHVQEHRTALPRIAGWLEELGMEFLGFQVEDPGILHRYRQYFPDDPAMVSLEGWDRFEAAYPDTFAGLYQFWVRFRPERRLHA